jgi:hypothetical protein
MKTKPKLPKSFDVGPHKVPVVREEIHKSENCTGFFDSGAHGHVIVVDERLDSSHAREVALHELMHAIDQVYGLNLKHNQVHGIGSALAQALAPYLKF